jgi:hypothetical protein
MSSPEPQAEGAAFPAIYIPHVLAKTNRKLISRVKIICFYKSN